MRLVLDVENTVTKRDDKLHLDPFEPTNKLVMVGCLDDKDNIIVISDEYDNWNLLQPILDKTTCMIGHNIVHDLLWLWECNFKYEGNVFDTMLGEYILQCGQKEPLSLEACAERHQLATKKQDTMKEYLKQGIGVDEIPHDELVSYLKSDLKSTQELATKICDRLRAEEYKGLVSSVVLTNRVAVCLAQIYQRGFAVDNDALETVRKEFTEEKMEIETFLQKEVRDFMGDTPINLNSPEQLSWLIYSRRPINKQEWPIIFSPYMGDTEYKRSIRENSTVLHKTNARQCLTCYGSGRIRKTKKDGSPFAKESRCVNCDAQGYLFIPTKDIAGMKFTAPTSKWISAHGWSTSKGNLAFLSSVAKQKGMDKAHIFLSKVIRLSALDSYLSSFVDGIKTNLKSDNKLHVRLLQHRTATGRFSGADPNMQNMPRGGTFPVKRVFVSRWEGGKILEADFAQLEFRTAAYLSQDKIAMKEIEDGFDVHSYTAKVITDAGQPTTRQEGKSHTFAPLYGATGFGRSKAEAKYYKQFTEKYGGIALWHSQLAKEALTQRKITTPSGRQFAFPNVERRSNGTVSYFTQIKNFPVQSFATADIVPITLLELDRDLMQYQSCIVNTVHDSIVIDVHPNEINDVLGVIKNINGKLKKLVDKHFKVCFNVPLLLEAKIGDNWLDTKDVA